MDLNSCYQETKSWLSHGEWVMAGLTLIYVGITAFYAWTSHKTLRAIEDQGKQAKDEAITGGRQFAEQLKVSRDAADAALQSSQTAINAERAWILVQADATGEFPRKAQIYIRGKNWGRTPAEISRCSATYFPLSLTVSFPRNHRTKRRS